MLFDLKDEELTRSTAWKLYEKSKDYFNQTNLITTAEQNNRMYIGDQWYGANIGNEKLPIFNIIKPIIRYKVAVIAQNIMSAVYSNMGEKNEEMNKACELLTQYFSQNWENGKMDIKSWKVIKNAAIEDCSFIYFPGADVTKAQVLSTTQVMLADEQNENLQEQEYIIIPERLPINRIKREARENGIEEEKILQIVSDEDKELMIGNKKEVQTDDGKCTSLLFLYMDDDGIAHWFKTTSTVLYQPDRAIRAVDTQGEPTGKGLRSYPIVPFTWEDDKGTARGCGEVRHLKNNQMELNKTAARRSLSIKQTAYSKIVYSSKVTNPDELDKVGAKIKIEDTSAQKVSDLVSYLQPQAQGSDVSNYCEELKQNTRELAGAGDVATAGINPERASGQAIIAAKDMSELPLNEQVARYRQFVEDVARVWFDIWVAYNPNGITISTKDENRQDIEVVIPGETLEQMKVNIRIDVSQNSPFSKFAREQAISKLFEMKAITFEEFVESLDKDSVVPKEKLQDIIDKRVLEEQQKQQLIQALELIKQYQQIVQQAGINVGGVTNEMQAM